MTPQEVKALVANKGFACLSDLLDDATSKAIEQRLDHFAQATVPSKAIVPDEYFNQLIVDERLLQFAKLILGEDLLFHHANGRAAKTNASEKPWHHDFDGVRPWRHDEPLMIHLMIYPRGLSMDNGPLMVLPGSHTREVPRAFPLQFAASELPGSETITGGNGLVVILNSALWHARRKPARLPRYDLNISYCQPGAQRPERAEWRDVLNELRDEAEAPFRCLFREEEENGACAR